MNTISYVIPTLNSAETLDTTLLSLRSQKGVDANIIVVDSGSIDATLDICKRWNVRTLYAEPGNMYRAINTGLRECDTEWLAYINSDDWLYPDSIARLINQAEISNAELVYGSCDYTDSCGRFLYSFAPAKPSQLLSLFRMRVLGFPQQSVIFRSLLYKKLFGFNEDYRLSADMDFYLRALQLGASFTSLPNPSVACFRLHENQLSNKQSQLMQSEVTKVCNQLSRQIKVYDWSVLVQWKLANMPHYLIRLFRQSLLSGRTKITKSMQASRYLELNLK